MAKFIDTDLIEQIESFLSKAEMKQSSFGKEAINDANLLPDLKDGRELRRGTRERVIETIKHLQVAASEKSDAPIPHVNAGPIRQGAAS